MVPIILKIYFIDNYTSCLYFMITRGSEQENLTKIRVSAEKRAKFEKILISNLKSVCVGNTAQNLVNEEGAAIL